jgi:hypothetical protein
MLVRFRHAAAALAAVTVLAPATAAAGGGERADVWAMDGVRAVQIALEVYRNDHPTYAGATRAKLEAIQPAVKRVAGLRVDRLAKLTYRVSVRTPARRTFTAHRHAAPDAGGRYVRRTCTPRGSGRCPGTGRW